MGGVNKRRGRRVEDAEKWEKGFLKLNYMEENKITETIIGCAIKVHKVLGPGLLESTYEAGLAYEISKSNLEVKRQQPIPMLYETIKLDCGFRADIIVEKKVIVEV